MAQLHARKETRGTTLRNVFYQRDNFIANNNWLRRQYVYSDTTINTL